MNSRHFIATALTPLLLIACSDSSDRPSTPPAVACSGSAIAPDRLFLQQLGSDRAIIKWRGNADGGTEADAVCFGTDMAFLNEDSLTTASVTETGHSEAVLEGLTPDTTYYYSVGGAGSAQPEHSFRTAPETGELPSDGNIRLWIVGDSGVNSQDNQYQGGADPVRDAYLNWVEANGGEPTDLFLMLGDNAYPEGTDEQHQVAVFDTYPGILASTGLWPTIGNHEMGTFGISTSSDPDSYQTPQGGEPDPAPDRPFPYLNIHTLPTQGETGGIASGTEQYYSFDYGTVHVVSLDSQLALRDASSRAAMLQWLQDDLASNTSDWTVVIFHHPPYTKGSHDSDTPLGEIDQPIFDMREQFTPVFDEYGVDVVYSGHSHIYERSLYIGGHTGLSDTFDPATQAELNQDGQPASGQGDEEYSQITGNGTDDKVVYTVAGNGGKVTFVSNGFPHPVHFFNALVTGSVVVDAGESSLTARFIDANGEELDSFTINR